MTASVIQGASTIDPLESVKSAGVSQHFGMIAWTMMAMMSATMFVSYCRRRVIAWNTCAEGQRLRKQLTRGQQLHPVMQPRHLGVVISVTGVHGAMSQSIDTAGLGSGPGTTAILTTMIIILMIKIGSQNVDVIDDFVHACMTFRRKMLRTIAAARRAWSDEQLADEEQQHQQDDEHQLDDEEPQQQLDEEEEDRQWYGEQHTLRQQQWRELQLRQHLRQRQHWREQREQRGQLEQRKQQEQQHQLDGEDQEHQLDDEEKQQLEKQRELRKQQWQRELQWLKERQELRERQWRAQQWRETT